MSNGCRWRNNGTGIILFGTGAFLLLQLLKAKYTRAEQCSVECIFGRYCDPLSVREVTLPMLSRYAVKLRKKGLEPDTVAKHLRKILAALRLVKDMNLISVAPSVKQPKRVRKGKAMKGRPITANA